MTPTPSPVHALSWDDLDLDAAVDAAARDWWVRTTRSGVGFDDLNAHDQHTARAFVRPIVKAAAPAIAAASAVRLLVRLADA
jgi:hypothetical protein